MAPKTLIAVLNWKQYAATADCLQSLQEADLPEGTSIHVLDNESNAQDLDRLRQQFSEVQHSAHQKNLGFSGAYNAFFEEQVPTLQDGDRILILNNDTVIDRQLVRRMVEQVDMKQRVDMVAAQMLLLSDRQTTDNRGLCLYQSGLSYTRTKDHHKLFAPSGGCGLYTVRLLRALREQTGHFFDDAFFCYNEDLDMGYRAQLLGFKAAYAEQAIVYHHRSLSTGGQFNEFIMYYCLRNVLYAIVKNTPLALLILFGPYIAFIQGAIIVRCLCQLKFKTTFRIYWHCLKAMPSLLRKRQVIQKHRVLSSWKLAQAMNTGLYDLSYLKMCLQTLLKPNFIKSKDFSVSPS